MLTVNSIKPGINRYPWIAVFIAAFATFTTYFCMYGFRKPFTAATFDGETSLGISFKSALVIAQVLGYMTSKFVGIKFISELDKTKRARYILSLLGTAHLSLLLLALIPKTLQCNFFIYEWFMSGLDMGICF